MQPQSITTDVLLEKYAKGDEKSAEDIYHRVAKGIASIENQDSQQAWENTFFANMQKGAIGAGRIMSAAGTSVDATLMNCFVQPVGDSIQGFDSEGNPGIYEALREAAETMRRGGGVGYNFSKIRPKNAVVGSVGAMASGPCSYIDVFDISCKTIESAGGRRGAQMGVLNIDHPDVEEFITAKRTPGRWNNFNVSVFVTDEFMQAKNCNDEIELIHKAKPSKKLIDEGAYQRNDGIWVYKKVNALDLWSKIMKSNYDFAEPGILFRDNMNSDNNLRYCETLDATNPCVTGDTLILTDVGYLRIDSLVGQDVQIWNGFEWSWVVPKITGENQEIFDLEFSDGTKLSCTPYHKFILADGTRVEAKDLQFDSKLSKFNFPVISGLMNVDCKKAYTQGFYSGDGQKETNRIWLYNEKCNLINKLSISAFSDQSTDSVKRIMASLDSYPADKDFVPNNTYDISTRLNWLAGLIDSDGSMQDKAVTIWSVDRSFLNNVKLMLNTLGVSGTISIGRKAGQKDMPDGRGGFAIYDNQDCWRIIVSGSNISKLRDLGLVTYRVDISGITNREASRFIQLTFKQKRQYLEPNVYCFNEEKNHSGIFNGIMTAQCAEQPLPNYGCCDLGPIILPKFVRNPFTSDAYFDYISFEESVAIQVRFLDNTLDATLWPLEQQRIEANNKRRIGVGFTGLANALAMLGIKYNGFIGLDVSQKIAETMRNAAYTASVNLAKEKGSFPLLNIDKYLEEGTFASRLPDHIKTSIKEFGIRNSHLLSIAPTGTVSLAFADNASNGIEPPYSLAYTRKKRMSDGSTQEYAVVDHSLRVYLSTLEKPFADTLLKAICDYSDIFFYMDKKYIVKDTLPPSIVTALELTPAEHVAILKIVQPYIDTSISKTVNIPSDYPFDDFKTVYDQAWESKLKGISTYRPNNILGSVLSVDKPKEASTQTNTVNEVDPNNVLIVKRPTGKLQSVTDKIQYYGDNGDYTFYVTVSFMKIDGIKNGAKVTIDRPIEIFITVSPESVPAEWVTVYSRTMSLIARTSFNLFTKALQDNRSISTGKHQIRYDWYTKSDGTKVPRHHNSDVAVISYAIQQILAGKDNNYIEATVPEITVKHKSLAGKECPECGAKSLIKVDGCDRCDACHYVGSCGS